MLRRYRCGFEPWGLLLLGLIMLPNLLWACIPAPQDVLRSESLTPVTDMLGSVAQVAMIAALLLLRHAERPQTPRSRLCVASAMCVLGYWLVWVLYYAACTDTVVILMQTLLPCAALLLFAADRRNLPAFVCGGVFTLCHIIFALVNFIF